MNEITSVEMIQVKEDAQFPVDARQLHAWLGGRQEFANWIKGRISDYGFIEGNDFLIILSKTSVGRPRQDYLITLDMAKELAMVEKNERGKEARTYFIEAGNRLRSILQEAQKPLSQLELLLQSVQSLVDVERRQTLTESVVYQLSGQVQELNTILHYEEHYVTVAGFLNLLNRKDLTPEEIRSVGVKSAKICREEGISISTCPSGRWGKVNQYPKEIIERAMQEMGLVA